MSGSFLGHGVARVEDIGMLTGSTRYLDDRRLNDVLYVSFVRSQIAHGRVTGIDIDDARRCSGVVDVFTGRDLDLAPLQGFVLIPEVFNRPVLATDTVRYVGDPIVAVVASSPEAAADAAELVVVDYEALPVVVDPRDSLRDEAPILFEEAGSNLVCEYRTEADQADLGGHDHVVRGRFVNQRVAGVPMETSAALGLPDGERVELWCTTQMPFAVRDSVAEVLRLEPTSVRVRTEAVGGGFGSKSVVYPEFAVVAALALRLGRPVKWTESRTENMINMSHGRDQIQDYELGLSSDGRIRWLRADVLADAGSYPIIGGYLPALTMLMASGPYRIPTVDFRARSAATNTTPTAAFRGAGRPEATAALERLIDMAADELDIDPAEIRLLNLRTADEFPVTTATGATMDVGDYQLAFTEVLNRSGYDNLRAEQERRRQSNESLMLGIGLSIYVEVTAGDLYEEFGSVSVETDGHVTLRVGTHSQGQGHATAFAQIVGSVLGVEPGCVALLQGDTDEAPHGMGTVASRSIQTAGSALHEAATIVLEQAKKLAAHLLEANTGDITVGTDGLSVAGVPTSTLSWADLAVAADGDDRPEGMDRGLQAEIDFDQGAPTFPFGAHVAVVEVDVDTGSVVLVRHVAVDDCGRIINPALAEGQVHGGIAQGAAQALYEEVRFDDDGTPLNTNLIDYALPGPTELPSFDTYHTETPTPLNPLGAKGIGEAGTIGSLPAVQNAVIDALSHLGVRHLDMPLSPERVWRSIVEARG